MAPKQFISILNLVTLKSNCTFSGDYIVLLQLFQHNLSNHRADGRIILVRRRETWDFTSLSTEFQSYKDNG